MDIKMNVNEPKDGFYNTSNSVVLGLRQFLPEHRYDNLLNLRAKIATNKDLFDEATTNAFSTRVNDNDELKSYYSSNPDAYEKGLNNFKGQIYDALTTEINVGESFKTSINKRAKKLIDTDNVDSGYDFIDIIKNNKKNYEEFGLIEDNEVVLKNDDNSALNILTRAKSNGELLDRLMSDKYEQFMSTVNNSNNSGAFDLSNPADLAKAYAIWDKFGKEGLTQYGNYEQFGVKSVAIQEQDQRVQKAYEYLQTAKKNGKSINEHVVDFFGQGEDRFTITPVKRSLEFKQHIPEDFNNYTAKVDYNAKSTEEEIASMINQSIERTFLDKMFDFGSGGDKIRYTNANREAGVDWKDIPQFKSYAKVTGEDILFDLENGVNSDNLNYALSDMIGKVKAGAFDFTFEDIVRTVASNADSHAETEDGTIRYAIDYDNAELKTKWAIEMLRADDENYGSAVYEDEGYVYFEPEIMKRVNEMSGITTPGDSTAVAQYDKWGDVVAYENEQTWGDNIVNLFKGSTRGAVKTFLNFGGQDFIEKALIPALETIDIDDSFKRYYYRDYKPSYADEAFQDASGYFGGAEVLTQMGLEFLTAYNMGKGIPKVGRSFRTLKNLSKSMQAQRMGVAAKSLKGGSIPKRFKVLYENFSKRRNALSGILRTESGWLAMDATLGSDYTKDFRTFALDTIDNETSENVERYYERGGRAVQMGIDALTSLSAAVIFDNLLAGVKYGKDFIQKGRGKKVLSKYVDPETGMHYRVDTPQYRSDAMVLWKNIVSPLKGEKIDLEKLTDEAIWANRRKVVEKEMNDVIERDGFGEVSSSIVRQMEHLESLDGDIDKSIRLYNNQRPEEFRMTEEEVSDVVYSTQINAKKDIANTIYNTIKKADLTDSHVEYLARTLETTVARVKKMKNGEIDNLINKKGSINGRLSIEDAVAVTNANPMTRMRRTNYGYEVYKAPDDNWAFDMAERLRGAMGSETTATKSTARGSEVDIDGKKGFIEEETADDVIVRFEDGEIRHIAKTEKVDLPAIRRDNPVDEGIRKTKQEEARKRRIAKQGQDLIRKTRLMDETLEISNLRATLLAADNNDYGLNKDFFDEITGKAGYKKPNKASARKIAGLVGTSRGADPQKLGKNKTPISEFDRTKKSIDKGIAFKYGNKTFMTNRKTSGEMQPSVWLIDEDELGERLVPNPNFRRIDENVTFINGRPTEYVLDTVDGDQWFRPAREGENGYYLNIQQSHNHPNLKMETKYAKGIDGRSKIHNGETIYKVEHESQVVDPRTLDDDVVKADRTRTEIVEDC